MRLSFSGRLAAALMLLALGGYATAQERLTLRIADQKGGMRSQLEAANALQNLPYDIKWAEFPAAAPLAEALNAGAVDAGIIGDAPLLFALANGAPVKAIAVDKSNPAGILVLVGVVNLPIIHYSVYWWNTLHQGSTNLQQTIDPSMRLPLRICIFAFLTLSVTLTLMRLRNLILQLERRRPWVVALVNKGAAR